MKAFTRTLCQITALALEGAFSRSAWCQAAAPAKTPAAPNTKPKDSPLPVVKYLELGISPSLSEVWLSCKACNIPDSEISTGGASVSAGFRRERFLLSAYGEFGRSLEGPGISHSAIGGLAQFGFASAPIALRARLFHDVWRVSGGSAFGEVLPSRHASGFGAGLDLVLVATNPNHYYDTSLCVEAYAGFDVADLGTFTDLAGPRDVDAHVIRGQLGLRFSIDTRLGCGVDCERSP
jgi:hypothetical protein